MRTGTSVETSDLTRHFGSFVAVDRISFSVREGEVFGFLGSNGAGKSTTIRMLCGLLRPTSGQAWVQGLDVYSQSEQIKQNIGYMSQRFSLYDELTVEENIDFFAGVYAIPARSRRQRKEFILAEMGLENRRKIKTVLLPGGWKQRLALGCAVLHQPAILFLDEPTSGVDPLARRSFWDLIYRLAEAGHTVFVTTHYMDEAEYCHRIALMDSGRIIALDTPRSLREGLASDQFLQLESSDTLKALQVLSEGTQFRDVSVFGGGLRLRASKALDAEALVRSLMQDSAVQIRSLTRVEPSMEDVFVARVEDYQRSSR